MTMIIFCTCHFEVMMMMMLMMMMMMMTITCHFEVDIVAEDRSCRHLAFVKPRVASLENKLFSSYPFLVVFPSSQKILCICICFELKDFNPILHSGCEQNRFCVSHSTLQGLPLQEGFFCRVGFE